ncbi:MAG: hypothetical protein IKL65_01380 [Bacilli bacterium]|nr:hypothetical protein [Bacilli bacterium]
MKKIFIACSKHFYEYIPEIKKKLEFMGYDVILPNFYDTPMIEGEIKQNLSSEDHIEFCGKSFIESQKKTKECDAILVLNFDRTKRIKVYPKRDLVVPKKFPNYIGGSTFLEMYDAYQNNKEIFVYTDIPEEDTFSGILHDEVEGMGTKPLYGNLFNIKDNYIKYEKNNLLNYFTKSQLANIEKIEDLYARTFIITSTVFKDKKDKAGKPYFDHLFRVSMRLDNPIEQVAALLHDIVEDTDVTFKDLLEIGFPIEVLEIVKLVTKPSIDTSNMTKNEKLKIYSDEIDMIINSGNIGAIRLKEADMSDNFNENRLKELPEEKQEWFKQKYGKQLVKLRRVVERNKIL